MVPSFSVRPDLPCSSYCIFYIQHEQSLVRKDFKQIVAPIILYFFSGSRAILITCFKTNRVAISGRLAKVIIYTLKSLLTID